MDEPRELRRTTTTDVDESVTTQQLAGQPTERRRAYG